jgi:hypothetical protein
MTKLWSRVRGHFQEYIARYAVLATAVLTPVAGLAGAAAADLGGIDTPGGRAALAIASAAGTGIAAVTFIRNLGIWQMLDTFGIAPGASVTTIAPPAAAPSEEEVRALAQRHPDAEMGAGQEPLPTTPDRDRSGEEPIDPVAGGTP